MPRVLTPLAQGVEEMEAVIVTDTLRRAGWTVVLAGLEAGNITASRDVVLLPDTTWDQIDPQAFDLIVLPGGAGGAKRLRADQRVIHALQLFAQSGKWIAAICAAPSVLHAAGILAGRNATCYPGWEAGLALTKRHLRNIDLHAGNPQLLIDANPDDLITVNPGTKLRISGSLAFRVQAGALPPSTPGREIALVKVSAQTFSFGLISWDSASGTVAGRTFNLP